MKTILNFIKGSRLKWSLQYLPAKSFIALAMLFSAIQVSGQTQNDQYTKPNWWFGVAAGENFNFYHGSTQELTTSLTIPAAFHDGKGAGIYLAPLIEFHRPDSRLGVMFQIGYDNRKGKFDEILTPCNCPADLSTRLSYLTIEPSIRFAPFKGNFYLYGGPRIAINLAKSFTYQLKTNPAFPDQVMDPAVKSDFSKVSTVLGSVQLGIGYDIPVSTQRVRAQFVISPFINFQPYSGQGPRTIETWNITTLRAGVAFKFGRGRKVDAVVQNTSVPAAINHPASAVTAVSDVDAIFIVNSPANIPVERRVRETFPIRNYVFFNAGSVEIPDRYVLLTRDQVKDFKEDQLEVFSPKRLSGRSSREMVVYYNLLNVLGDRMGKNPSTTVRLTGASMEGPDDGRLMAESIKNYLVEVFQIDKSRISVEGRVKPRIPSEQPGGTLELDLLRECDRRVTIFSNSPSLLMEFQSGPDVPLKSVEFYSTQDAPVDSYVSFDVKGVKEAITNWTLEVKDDQGNIKNFGPYTNAKISIPGKSILGVRPEGDYKITMTGQTKSGTVFKKETRIHMSLWVPTKREEGMRFSVLFEFNESKSIAIYEKYLTDIVTPKIPAGGTVILHGHTDIIGNPEENLDLSMARATEVEQILKKALDKAGRTDVKFVVHGFGEDSSLAPFENKFPEERFYNRTVIIDIIPAK